MTPRIVLLCTFTLLNVLGMFAKHPGHNPGRPFSYTQIMVESIHQAFIDQVKSLDGDRHQLRPGIKDLRHYHTVALNSCGALSVSIAEMQARPNSELFERAFARFEAGKVEDAWWILSDSELEAALRNAYRQGLRPGDPAFQQPVNNYLLKARLSILRLHMEAASEFYMKAIHTDRQNYEVLLEYSRFLYKLEDEARAVSFTERALELADSDFEKALALDLLANIQAAMARYDQAANTFEESRRLLAGNESDIPAIFQVDNVRSIRNKAVHHAHSGSATKAWGLFEQALMLGENLSTSAPELYSWEHARTHILFADSYAKQGAYELALEQYRLGADLIERMTNRYPMIYQVNLGKVLASIASIEINLNHSEVAVNQYQTAFGMIDSISQKLGNPYHPEMGEISNSLARVYLLQHRLSEAELALKHAQKLLQPLAIKYPQAYELSLAETFHLRGNLFRKQFDFDQAFHAYEQGLELRRGYSFIDSARYQLALAESYADIGRLYLLNNQFDLGYRGLNDAIELCRRAASGQMPSPLRTQIAVIQMEKGAAYLRTHQYGVAEQALLESKEKLMAAHPLAGAGALADCQSYLGALYRAFDDYGLAEAAYVEAVSQTQSLLSQDSMRYMDTHARMMLGWARCALMKGEPKVARVRTREAVSLLEKGVLEQPRVYLPLLVLARRQLAEVEVSLGFVERAQELALASLEIQEGLVEVRPEVYNLELARLCFVLGQAYRAENSYRQSSVYYLRALDILEQLQRAYGDWVLPDIVAVRHAFADTYRSYGAYEMATQQYRKAHQAVQELWREGEGAFDLERSRIQAARAHLLIAQKRYEEAFDMYQEAAGLQRVLADQYGGFHNKELAQTLGNMAWCQVFVQEFEAADEFISQAVELDATQEWLVLKQAPIALLSGDYAEARAIYQEYAGRNSDAREVFLADLTLLEQSGIEHADIRKARRLLEK